MGGVGTGIGAMSSQIGTSSVMGRTNLQGLTQSMAVVGKYQFAIIVGNKFTLYMYIYIVVAFFLQSELFKCQYQLSIKVPTLSQMGRRQATYYCLETVTYSQVYGGLNAMHVYTSLVPRVKNWAWEQCIYAMSAIEYQLLSQCENCLLAGSSFGGGPVFGNSPTPAAFGSPPLFGSAVSTNGMEGR